MTDQEKTNELLSLIEAMCDVSFSKETSTLDSWILKLNKVYANGYRHTYSDIFFKVQTIISDSSDSETLEILGENLNVLGTRINELLLHNTDDANLKNTSVSYKKFADHINLEIGRYNFIKSQFQSQIDTVVHTENLGSIDCNELAELNKKVDSLSKAIDKTRPITTEAKKQLDGLDDKLENNKISSITALTIFSAVVLAFSGGITFEAGVFKGMAESSPYRLVFTVSLVGFVLFNTIFLLLYLVGKMIGKTILPKCRYISLEKGSLSSSRKCADGYCCKECVRVTTLCQFIHEYFFVLLVDATLLWIQFADFILWFFRGSSRDALKVFILQISPLLLILFYMVVQSVMRCNQEKRIKLQFKIQLVNRIICPEETENSTVYYIGQMIANVLGRKTVNLTESFLSSIKDEKVISDKDYKVILKKLDSFVDQQIIKDDRLCTFVSHRVHKTNKKNWESLKEKFRGYLTTK